MENFLKKASTILWPYYPYVTVYQPIPVKNDDIDFDIANFSKNLRSKYGKKKTNQLMGAKIGQNRPKSKFEQANILFWSINDLRMAVKVWVC